MPWDNQSSGGGGWKSGGGGPWGQPPRNSGGGGGPNPPDLEELLRRSQDRLKSVLPGGGRKMNPFTLIAILTVAAALIAYNFFTFRVQPDELGVVLLFGKYDRQANPGLNFRLPYPIETVYTPQVTRVNRVTIGQSGEGTGGNGRDIPEESLMLTGDENIVDINFSVFWKISNARDYLFNMQDPEGSVKAAAESAMREVVGRSNIQPLLTQARQITESDVQELIQTTMDEYAAGVDITQVQLLKVDPPSEVIAAFRDVQAARADQERLQNEAQTYANRVIPEARGQASQVTEAAIGYRDRITNEAQGQADRFTQVYDSYRAAPDITRQRMYIETIEGIFSKTSKVIIDERGGSTGVIPYLPLDQLQQRAPSAPTTSSGGGGGGSGVTGGGGG